MVLYPKGKHVSIFFPVLFMLGTALESKQVLCVFFMLVNKNQCFTEKTQTRASSYNMLVIFMQKIQPQALRGPCLYMQIQWLRFWSCQMRYWQSSTKISVGLGWFEAFQDQKKRKENSFSSLHVYLAIGLTVVLAKNTSDNLRKNRL